ncbi:hypothetical protein ACFSSA_05065 [Luteolibacter algae]|uniref:Uncharacterized protein n=1 Tax=Luteolibacter algae TaxID=454151 RepID=A0ABW5D5N7_9BACT
MNKNFLNPPVKPRLIGLFTLATAAITLAGLPQKAPLTRYTGLWTNSPFTSKPPPTAAAATINPFEDFTLTGIAPVPGGYRITIISKKNPELKKVLEPGKTDEFTVVSVNRNPEKALGTTVVLSNGNVQGSVTFEPELITLKTAPAAAPPQEPQNLPPGVNPAQPQTDPNAAAQRQPRPRIVPPPATNTPSNGNSGSSNSSQSRERSRRR